MLHSRLVGFHVGSEAVLVGDVVDLAEYPVRVSVSVASLDRSGLVTLFLPELVVAELVLDVVAEVKRLRPILPLKEKNEHRFQLKESERGVKRVGRGVVMQR